MQISVVTAVPFTREQVFAVMRDEMPALVPFLPNVESVTVESREELAQGEVKLLNRWQAAKTEIPAVARPFIDPAKMFWLDHAHWFPADWQVKWRLEMGFMAERVRCEGHTRYREVNGQTEVQIEGELDLDLGGLLPGFLAKKAKPAVESFVVKLVEPNFQKTAEAVRQLLESRLKSA